MLFQISRKIFKQQQQNNKFNQSWERKKEALVKRDEKTRRQKSSTGIEEKVGIIL